MYPDTRDDSTDLIKKIVALTAAAICLLMFFLPWIRVGFFSDSTQIGMRDLLEDALGADIDDILSELNNISDFLLSGASYDETLKQAKVAKSAITAPATVATVAIAYLYAVLSFLFILPYTKINITPTSAAAQPATMPKLPANIHNATPDKLAAKPNKVPFLRFMIATSSI